MAQNTLFILHEDTDKNFPLRGDMDVHLNVIPAETFKVTFVTYTDEQFEFHSTVGTFRNVDGTITSSMTVGGATGLFLSLMYNATESTWDILDNNLVSLHATNGGDGGGSSQPEFELIPDSAGVITPNKADGMNFCITMTKNLTLDNPVGYAPGDTINIVFRQDAVGSRILSYGTQYAMPLSQPPALTTGPGAIDMLVIHYTTGGEFLLTPQVNSYTIVTHLARIKSNFYYMLGGAAGLGAFNKTVPGDTIYILRDGLGAEATGTILGTTKDGSTSPAYVVAGVATATGQRPLIKMLPTTRPAYGKGVLNIENDVTVEIRDLRITGARNADADARGISPNIYTQHVKIKNVEITDCHNGVLWGNETFHGSVTLEDCNLNGNGIGGIGSAGNDTTGFTHNLYGGYNDSTLTAKRSSFTNAVSGHNFKTRCWKNYLDQVFCEGAKNGYELNLPYAGYIEATNCVFHKVQSPVQGNMIAIGEEGVQTTRTRGYIFRNCRFQNDIDSAGRDIMFLCSFDKQYPVQFIDCEFIGNAALALEGDPNNGPTFVGMITKKGVRYYPGAEPVYTLTGGPIGPILPVGYFPVPMTPEGA